MVSQSCLGGAPDWPKIMDKIIKFIRKKNDFKDFIEKRSEGFISKLESSIPSSGIFRVPPNLLDVWKSAFLPEIFSFGPFHHEEYKLCVNFKRYLLQRLYGGKVREIKGSKTADKDLESQPCMWPPFWQKKKKKEGISISRHVVSSIFKAANELLQETQEYYKVLKENYYDIDHMVLDGCFIVELLCFYNKRTTGDDEGNQPEASDARSGSSIFNQRQLLPAFQRDLIKLENQFPFFVLEEFFLIVSGSDEPSSLQEHFMTFFCSMVSLDKSIYKLEPRPKRGYAHPLDLFRSLFIFSMRKEQEGNEGCKNPKLTYSAQDLQEAGVIIEKKNSTLLDISFDCKNGVLHIPPLSINENMIVALLNFVAYEQCDQFQEPYFMNYFLFLDSLISTTKDVEILHKKEIIRCSPGMEKEVAELFNNFCKGMLYSFNQTYLSVDMNAVNSHCEAFYDSKRRSRWSNLERERSSSPWTFLSLIAAIVLLILTMLQTFFTIFPYYHPN